MPRTAANPRTQKNTSGAQPMRPPTGNPMPMNAEMEQCIQLCLECQGLCLETLMTCVEESEKGLAVPVRSLMDCAEICQTSANFMRRNSDMHGSVCGLCEQICEQCAQELEQTATRDASTQLQHCAEMCRTCAEACHNMATMMAPALAR